MLKLNLQMFAEDDTGADDVIETNEPEPTPGEQFDQMYYGTAADDDQQEDVDDESGNDDAGANPADDDNGQQNQQAQQHPWKNQQNAQFAAERRRQEEQQRTAQAVQAARDAVYAEQYKDHVNPYTGQPIRTEADYKAYIQAYNAEILKNAGIQQAQFDQIVNADPRIQQAQQIIAQQNALQQQSKQMREQQKLDAAVEKIKQFDKSVKTQQDIIDNPHFQEIAAMYNRGYSLEDAYYLANRAEMEQKKQAATRQQTMNQMTSKQHLKKTGNSGAGNEVVVPADVMAIYREMFPDKSDAEIKVHYARMNKK